MQESKKSRIKDCRSRTANRNEASGKETDMSDAKSRDELYAWRCGLHRMQTREQPPDIGGQGHQDLHSAHREDS